MALRRALILGGGVLAVLLVAVLGLAIAVQNGAFQEPLLRQLGARVHRPLQAKGGLQLRVFSSRPRLEVRGLVVGNPTWMPAGELARVERLVLRFAPSLAHPLRIDTVELHGARLRPRRLADGRANWQLRPPRGGYAGAHLPAIRGLVLREVRMDLDDQRRHLVFHGSIEDASEQGLRLLIRGELNGHPMQGRLEGDALASVSKGRAYAFRFDERSGRSRFRGEGRVPEPFDLSRIDFDFQAEGPDLQQLYNLVGVHLPPTGPYELKGRLERRGPKFRFRELAGRSGGSDVAGEVTIDASGERRRLEGELHSHRLRLADVGRRASGEAAEPTRHGGRIPDRPLPLDAFRDRDVDLRLMAEQVVAGPLTLPRVAMRLTAGHGALEVKPFVSRTGDGRVEATLHLDLGSRPPAAKLSVDFHDADLGALLHGRYDPPPLEAPLRGGVTLESAGADLHSLAAALHGTVSVGLGEGRARAVITEALGLDLGAIGLALSKSHEVVPVRCGIARLSVAEGRVKIERLVVDAEPTLLTAEGGADLGRETLDLELAGQPKSPRLRVRSTLEVGGTLADPAPRVKRRAAGLQGAAALALATAVAPVAAVAALVDPGRGEDQDCGKLLKAAGR